MGTVAASLPGDRLRHPGKTEGDITLITIRDYSWLLKKAGSLTTRVRKLSKIGGKGWAKIKRCREKEK